MIKDFIRGFIFMFILLMLYLIAVNIGLAFFAEDMGLYENVPLYIIVALLLNIAPFVFIAVTDRIRKKKVMKEIDDFMKYGTRTTAIVTGIQDTGITINENPVARITLNVNPDMAGAFVHTAELTVSRVKIPRVGDTVNVIYDPKDLSKFSIED